MKLYILLFFSIILISCSNSKKNNSVKTVAFNKENLSDFLLKKKDSMEVIQLETKENSLINEIERIYFPKNRILIYDRKKILLFDKQGKFISEIGKKGRGPEEYLQLTSMIFDADSQQVEIFDNTKRTLFIYNLEGDLVETKKADISFISFAKTAEGYCVYAPFVNHKSSEGYNLHFLDLDLRATGIKSLPTKNNFDRYLFTENFSKNGSELFFHHGLNDTIYKIKKRIIEPYLYVDFDEFKVPYDEISTMVDQNLYDKKVYSNTPSNIGAIKNVLINDSQLIFWFTELTSQGASPFYTGLYSRDKKDIEFYDSFSTSVAGVANTYPKFMDNEKSVYVTNAYELEKEEISYLEEQHNINLSLGDNPFLVVNYH